MSQGFRLRSIRYDARPVVSAADRARKRVLTRFGAYVRTRARQSMPRQDRPSEAGRPPARHLGLVYDLLLFDVDMGVGSVIVGPKRLNKPGLAPAALEEGGPEVILRHGKEARAWYRARPFMKPAFDEELRRMPPNWRDEIR